jgi:hypothetical protein
MRSTFRRGLELLSEPAPGSVQGQSSGSPRESSSEDLEGIGVPKNVTQLEPVISKLMRKVTINLI